MKEIVKSFYGRFLAFPIDDRVARYLREGWFEYEEQAFLWSAVRARDVFIDIGAHCGLYSALAAERITEGHVVAFEPNRELHGYLTANVREACNFKIVPMAIGPQRGEGVLNLEEEGGQAAYGFIQPLDAPAPDAIPIARLEDALAEAPRGEVTFVKIDIEGLELATLLAARDALRDRDDVVLIIEFTEANLRRTGETTEMLRDAVTQTCGLNLYSIDPETLELVPFEGPYPVWHKNLFASRSVDLLNRRLAEASEVDRATTFEFLARGRVAAELQAEVQRARDAAPRLLEAVDAVGDLHASLTMRPRPPWPSDTPDVLDAAAALEERTAALRGAITSVAARLAQQQAEIDALDTGRLEHVVERLGDTYRLLASDDGATRGSARGDPLAALERSEELSSRLVHAARAVAERTRSQAEEIDRLRGSDLERLFAPRLAEATTRLYSALIALTRSEPKPFPARGPTSLDAATANLEWLAGTFEGACRAVATRVAEQADEIARLRYDDAALEQRLSTTAAELRETFVRLTGVTKPDGSPAQLGDAASPAVAAVEDAAGALLGAADALAARIAEQAREIVERRASERSIRLESRLADASARLRDALERLTGVSGDFGSRAGHDDPIAELESVVGALAGVTDAIAARVAAQADEIVRLEAAASREASRLAEAASRLGSAMAALTASAPGEAERTSSVTIARCAEQIESLSAAVLGAAQAVAERTASQSASIEDARWRIMTAVARADAITLAFDLAGTPADGRRQTTLGSEGLEAGLDALSHVLDVLEEALVPNAAQPRHAAELLDRLSEAASMLEEACGVAAVAASGTSSGPSDADLRELVERIERAAAGARARLGELQKRAEQLGALQPATDVPERLSAAALSIHASFARLTGGARIELPLGEAAEDMVHLELRLIERLAGALDGAATAVCERVDDQARLIARLQLEGETSNERES
ncbi:FkbM family methyltransferase [Salinarimonas sp.]|uniref:FkbM family methyltransferase n=1 Tax=Salinarimonas sp. TaxID=2766526 RepID=UPI0032D97130